MRKIKWGVIGCGGIADRRTLPGMMLADNAELIAVMDANNELAQNAKEKYNAQYAFDNIEELLALPEINQTYKAIKNVKIKALLRNGYLQDLISKEAIMDILWCDSNSAEQLLTEFSSIQHSSSFFDDFLG